MVQPMLSDQLFALRERIGDGLSDQDLAVLIAAIDSMDRCERRLTKALQALSESSKHKREEIRKSLMS